MRVKVGDRFMSKEFNHEGTILEIDGNKALIEWDEKVFPWGVNKPPNSWVYLNSGNCVAAESLVEKLTRMF